MAAWIPRKHHRGSIRLAGYDYTQPGAYFITICTQDRACLFGEVVVKEMLLNDAGRLVQAVWEELPNHYPHVTLDAWVIMPNHVHGIVVIGENDPNGNKSDPMPNGKMRTATHGGPGGMTVGATHASPLLPRPQPRSLGVIVGSFKSAVTKRVNESRHTPGARLWQRNYYEHIIRNDESLNRIRQYINDNPAQWAFDRENPDAHAEADGPGRGTARRAPTRGPVIQGVDRPAADTETAAGEDRT